MKQGIIYMITNPTGRIYIGSTINFKGRLAYYKCNKAKTQTKLYNSFKKYGFDTHKIEIIWSGNVDEMLKYETLIGLEFDVLSQANLNCKLPKYGEQFSFISEETRQKMSSWQIGRKMSDEAKKKMSLAKIGKSFSKEALEKRSNTVKKPIIQMDLESNFIKNWPSATDASKELKINLGHISSCCRGERKSIGGFKWNYKK